MDTTLIVIGIFIFLALVLLISFLVKNLKKERFVSDDGSIFNSQSDLDLYQELLVKTKPLFEEFDGKLNSQSILGYDKSFLINLKSEGFKDLKTLFKYRKQFKSLAVLINP